MLEVTDLTLFLDDGSKVECTDIDIPLNIWHRVVSIDYQSRIITREEFERENYILVRPYARTITAKNKS